MSIRQNKLPIKALERIDDLCAAFEQQWRLNESPAVESAIPDNLPPVEQEALLAELIVLEIDYRRRRGDVPTEREYADRFPQNPAVIHDAFADDKKRVAVFEPPTIARLAELFPALQLIEFIGAGGMGAVYKARQEGLDRVVALKILPEEFGHDIKFALRFTREARTLARLSHPNIVSVYEFGNIKDTYYFLMEYVDGTTLRESVAARLLTPEHALKIVPHLCDALQYAHDNGVVHRDVKPENILMAADGSVKIADFGLSRILGNESQEEVLTGTHQIMGTPRYMAPEQLEGSHGVDHRADIYSLGVVFYEMLTGELPIGRFAPPSKKVEIDVRLDEVVLRTLEKEPKRRYQHASQVKSDVQSITSTDDPAVAPTVVGNAMSHGTDAKAVSLEQQELAGRLLLTRRQLLQRVAESLQPLFRWQIVQILMGVLFVAVGARCWAPNTNVPHRVVCGGIVHLYGVLIIISGIMTCSGIKRIDYSKTVGEIRGALDSMRSSYLRRSPAVGIVWWLLWIPVSVALGFEEVLHPNSLWLSLGIGILGMLLSAGLCLKLLKSDKASVEAWRRKLSGKSITAACVSLDEIDRVQIQ